MLGFFSGPHFLGAGPLPSIAQNTGGGSLRANIMFSMSWKPTPLWKSPSLNTQPLFTPGWTAGCRTATPGTLGSSSVPLPPAEPPDLCRAEVSRQAPLSDRENLHPTSSTATWGALSWVQDPADHPWHDDEEQGQHLQVSGQDGASLGVAQVFSRE